MEKIKRNIGPVLIILAGCFWGSMGIFVRRLGSFGFSSVQIVSIRVTLAALVFCALLFFTWCYFHAINLMSLSAAAILLYTEQDPQSGS